MLKILMFGWEFPPFNSGGLGTACYGLSRALAAKNVNLLFVLPKKVDVKAPFMELVFADNSNFKLKALDSLLYPYITEDQYAKDFGLKLGRYGRSLLEEVYRYAKKSAKIARREKFDIIHAHDWLSFLAGIESKRITRKPLVVHVHATEFDRTGGSSINPDVYNIEKIGMEKADKVIAVSAYTKNILIKNYGIAESKIDVVYNGIDSDEYKHHISYVDVENLKNNFHKIVLYVGRMTLQKGPDYFIKAAKKVLEFDPNVRFIITGSGDMEKQIIEESAAYGIADKVFFTGFLRGDDLNKVYQAADLFVLPSVSEPFGITALESLAHRTPALISKQSGVSEVLHNVLKVDFWDIDEMANKILAVLKFKSLHYCLKTNSFEDLKKITWENSANKCIGIYQQLLN